MRADGSPFPPSWWGISLENVGLAAVRPRTGTYGKYTFGNLPALPIDLHGDWGWLLDADHYESHIGAEKTEENAAALVALQAMAAASGVSLPDAFTAFMRTPELHECFRSTTDCFLDLSPTLVPTPVGAGHLVRFLADSQGCIFWYLYLTPDGSDHAVVASPGFHGSEDEQWQEEEPDPADLVFAAESFEIFMCRFWIENELWFSEYDGEPVSDVGRRYIEDYRSSG